MGTASHILVVEDQAIQCALLQRMLSQIETGCQVEMALSARDALEKMHKTHFDVIVTDLAMPEMHGIAFTQAARELDQQVGIVWITACGCQQFSQEAKRLGVHSCLDKPARMDHIRATVRQALENAREGRA